LPGVLTGRQIGKCNNPIPLKYKRNNLSSIFGIMPNTCLFLSMMVIAKPKNSQFDLYQG